MIKQIDSWLIVDYHKGTVCVGKRLTKALKATEMPVRLKINIEIPDKPQLKAEATIRLSREEITELMFTEDEKQ